MNILGIETSCDETAAAVVKDGREVLSNVVISQIDIHREFGGVVPEVAARSHLEVILPVIDKALKEAFPKQKNSWNQIDGIAVTYGPGLPGALLIGALTARTLALTHAKPLYAIDHVQAHIYANWLGVKKKPRFPILALIVSGGHTQLVLLQDHFDYRILGQTQDDAVGEAFDKVAKLLGLSYPGGPAIAEAAKRGKADRYDFPISRLDNTYDFSFSGLKTAVLRHLQRLTNNDYSFPSFNLAPLLTNQQIVDTAASFQRVVVETLIVKTLVATREFQPQTVIVAGGVAANSLLRQHLREQLGEQLCITPLALCTDNAAMIAACGFWHAKAKKIIDPLTLEIAPGLTM